MAKHLDNKRDLLARMRHAQMSNEELILSTYKAQQMITFLTLYEDLNFRLKRMDKYDKGFKSRLEEYQNGKLTYTDMVEKLADYGIYMEDIHYTVRK